MTDETTRDLERRVLAGDSSALPFLRVAYLRAGTAGREDVPVRFWALTQCPVSEESEPCITREQRRWRDPDVGRAWRTPLRTLAEAVELYHRLGEPVADGAHHGMTWFTILDVELGKILNVTQGIGDSGTGWTSEKGFLRVLNLDEYARRAAVRQTENAKLLDEEQKKGPVPWAWFVKNMQRNAEARYASSGLDPSEEDL